MPRKTKRTRRPNVGPAPVRTEPIGACLDGMCRPEWSELGDGAFSRRDLPGLDDVERYWARPKGRRN